MKKFINSAKKVLLGNKKKGYTLPTNNKLYPAQWNWDSGFIALGYSHFKIKYALDELNTLIRGQWKDGMIPHILFHDLNTNYYPNHSVWACGNKIHSSGITQPPILAIIIKLILDKNKIKKEKAEFKKIIKGVLKYHKWFIKFRDPNNSGLVSILHPWESGYDNSPLWDDPMSKVKIPKNLKYKRGDNKVVNPEFRPLDIDYDRYVTIKNHLRKNNYNPNKLFKASLFNVVDVGFNSIFLRANKDLVKLLKMFDLKSNEIESYISRSPVWINCNWIIYQGLKNKDNRFANQIKKKTIDLVKQKGFNEYFSCKTGKGFGATNFSWTASLFLDLILENKYE